MENQAKTSKELFSVKDKVIILTGGKGFLGSRYADFLTGEGAKVIIWDLPEVDITQEQVVKSATEDILKNLGRIDVLINNAAMNPAIGSEESKKMFAQIEDYPVDLWTKELEVNLVGMFICSKAVIPTMKKQGKGAIINVASEVSEIAHDHRVYNESGKYKSPAYVASKTGVIGLTRALASQLGQYNIRVNALSPGGVEHPKMPKDFVERFGAANMFSRMARPEEYNGAILFLCSEASSFMTGHNLVIDGGKSAW
ncbi:MAG: SDR family oxidoreductase [Candidatus Staskawiczbacteria bacterium]|nr:SDR family oxidoreductase [Candidatus Staskawiczbacteria bacterium]